MCVITPNENKSNPKTQDKSRWGKAKHIVSRWGKVKLISKSLR